MPRTTPVRELQMDEKSEGALRRSSRIAQNSPVPSKVVQRRSSASNNDTPAKITKAKRLSLSQENGTASIEMKQLSEADNPDTPRRTRLTRSASKSPTSLAKAADTKPAAVKTRGRRGSQSKVAEEENLLDSPAPQNTRRRNTRSESISPTGLKDVEPAKTRTRRASITDKINQLEKIDEVAQTAEPKKRTRGRQSSLTEMPQLDAIEEADISKKEKDNKVDLESITEAVETVEKNAPSTSSTRESNGKEKPVEKNKIDKFNLSAVVKIEKTINKTPTVDSDKIGKPGINISDNKTKNREKALDQNNSDEARSDVSPKENSTAEVTVEKDVKVDNKATQQRASIDKIEEELKSLLNKNENRNSATPERINTTFEKEHEDKPDEVPKTNSNSTTDERHGNDKTSNLLPDEKIHNVKATDSGTPTVLSTNVDVGDTLPKLNSSDKSSHEVDITSPGKDCEMNETIIIGNESVNSEKHNVEGAKETSNDTTSDASIVAERISDDSNNKVVLPQLDNKENTGKVSTYSEELPTCSKISGRDGNSEDVPPACDDENSSTSKIVTPKIDYCNKSLEALLPEQLDLTIGLEGSFHLNLSTKHMCSSKEDLASSQNSESDILNKSDSSDKENTTAHNQITEDVAKPKAEKKTPLLDKSLAQNNQDMKSLNEPSLDDSCEPMDVDDPPLSSADVTENIKTNSIHTKQISSTPNKKEQSSVEFSDASVTADTIEGNGEIVELQEDTASKNNESICVTGTLASVDAESFTEKEAITKADDGNLDACDKAVVDEQTKEDDKVSNKPEECARGNKDEYSGPVVNTDSIDESDEKNINVSDKNKKSEAGTIVRVDAQNGTGKEVTTKAAIGNLDASDKAVVGAQAVEDHKVSSKHKECVKENKDEYSSPVFSMDSIDESDEENVNVSDKDKKSEAGTIVSVDAQSFTEKEVTTKADTADNENLDSFDKVVDEQTKEDREVSSKECTKGNTDGYSSPVFSIDSNNESDEEDVSNKSGLKNEQTILKIHSNVVLESKESEVRTDKSGISKDDDAELNSTPSKIKTPKKDSNMRSLNMKSPSKDSKGNEHVLNTGSSPNKTDASKYVEKKRTPSKNAETDTVTKLNSPSKKWNIMDFAEDNKNDDSVSKEYVTEVVNTTVTKANSPKRGDVKSPKVLKEKPTTTEDGGTDLDSCEDTETVRLSTSPKSKKRRSSVHSNVEEKNSSRRKSSEIVTAKQQSPKQVAKNIPTERGDNDETQEEITELIKNTIDELTSSSEDETEKDKAEINDFFDDMAEEGEEDTPSEGSNDIVCEGESINSCDTATEDDGSYEDDSFIDDEHEQPDLLSGEEDFLQGEQNKSPASEKTGNKRKRILTPSSSESEEEIHVTETDATNDENEVQDLEKHGKGNQEQPCHRDNIEVEKEPEAVGKMTNETNDEVERATTNSSNIPEDLMPSTNDVVTVDSSSDSESVSSVKQESQVEKQLNTTSTDKKSKRTSSITIQENIKLEDIQDGQLSSRISKVVDWFYSGIKASGDAGSVSLNVSLDYADQSSSDEKDEAELKSTSDIKIGSKRKSEELIENKSPKKIALDDDVFVENVEESVERDESRPTPQKPKRKSLQKQIEKEYSDGENIKLGSKRSRDEDVEHTAAKRNKYDSDFIVEDINTVEVKQKKSKKSKNKGGDGTLEIITDQEPSVGEDITTADVKKKKSKKSKNKGGDETLEIIMNQEPFVDEDNIPKTRKKHLKIVDVPVGALELDNEKLVDTKVKNKKKINKVESLKKKKVHLDEFNVEPTNKRKKLLSVTENADHIPCSSGILRRCISAGTSASTREMHEPKHPATKLKRKIPRKLLPTNTGHSNDSWESEVFDKTVRPSKSNKKMLDMKKTSKKEKTEIDSFNSKDFKNKMLYDSSRIVRIDTKVLLRKRNKNI